MKTKGTEVRHTKTSRQGGFKTKQEVAHQQLHIWEFCPARLSRETAKE